MAPVFPLTGSFPAIQTPACGILLEASSGCSFKHLQLSFILGKPPPRQIQQEVLGLRKLIIWAGLVAAPTVLTVGQDLPQSNYRNDPRLAQLVDFFDALGSPVRHLAPDFLAAADRHGLDWRLLPSICVVESGGGKNYRRNNVFGWGSAARGFSSIRESIYLVASRLANSKLYRNKGLDGKLATYNPRAGYPARVKSVMALVAPNPPRGASNALQGQLSPASGPQEQARLAPAP